MAAWVLALAAALGLAACQGPKKLDNFRQVRIGWSQEQVRELLGEPDQEEEASSQAKVWRFQGQNWYGSLDSTLIVTLLGGQVAMLTLSAPMPR